MDLHIYTVQVSVGEYLWQHKESYGGIYLRSYLDGTWGSVVFKALRY